MHVLSSLKDYAAPLTDKVKEISGGEDKSEKARASDPEFEAARKEWGRLNAFLTSMLETINQTVTAHRELSKPVDVLDNTLNLFYRESKINSKEVTQFNVSVSKMKEGTMKFGEMMLSYNVKEEIESWLAKLAEVKREINQRDALYLKYTRGEAEHKNSRVKAEQKGLLRDAATVVKLNKMEAEWTGDKETYIVLNAKVINDINGMGSRIFPVINEQVKTLATSQFWLFWALSEGYSNWHQQEVNKSSMRQRRRPTDIGAARASPTENPPAEKPVPATPTPTATPPETPTKQLPVPPKKLPPSPGGKALPTPPPKKPAADPAATTTPTTTPTASPTPTATAPTAIISQSGELKALELAKRNLEEEKVDLEKERERLKKEWEEIENEKIRFIRIKKEELQKIEEAKARNEEDYKERLRQLDGKNEVLEAERRAVAEEKMRLEKRIQLEEERIAQRKQMEEEYKRMEEERKSLEEKKIELAEGKMKKRLEEEWRRLEAKRQELEEERRKEEERKRAEQEARIADEKKRLDWEAAERKRKEEEARLEEEKERERLDRIKRQMEEERKRLESTKRRLIEEDDVLSVMVPVIEKPADIDIVKTPTTPTTTATTTTPQQQPPQQQEEVELKSVPSDNPPSASSDPTITKLLVKALYKYDAAEEGELSFVQGEIMIVDYDGDETGWWMAKKRNGEQGIVPANFVKKYDPENDDGGDDKKAPATTTTAPAAATAAVAAPADNGEKKTAPVEEKEPEKPKQEERVASGLPTSDLGKVRALYDYKATEEGELTFKKGDIISLLEKDTEGGWWIGEVNGEMGLFPKTYVEDLNASQQPQPQPTATPTTTATTATPVVATTDTTTTTTPTTTAKPFGGVKIFPDPIPKEKEEYVKALYDYTAQEDGELTFKEGDVIKVVDKDGDGNPGWWTGKVKDQVGTFPTNFTSEPYFG